MSDSKMNARPRIALVGAGGLGNVWAQTIATDAGVEFAAIVDPLIGSGKESAWLANHAAVPKFTTLAAAAAAGPAGLLSAIPFVLVGAAAVAIGVLLGAKIARRR